MRKIKFRAWDGGVSVLGLPQRMISWEELLEEDEFAKIFTGFFPDFFLMEYTGLTDKNGKEIYEGDICRREGWERSQLVRFNDGHFLFGGNFTIGQVFTSESEVIGNIYENPELLK